MPRDALVAQLRELLEQVALLVVELVGRLHQHLDDEVAAAGTAQARHALAAHRDDVAGLGAGRDVDAHGVAVPSSLASWSFRSDSSVGMSMCVPSAAAVIGIVTWQRSWSPLRE